MSRLQSIFMVTRLYILQQLFLQLFGKKFLLDISTHTISMNVVLCRTNTYTICTKFFFPFFCRAHLMLILHVKVQCQWCNFFLIKFFNLGKHVTDVKWTKHCTFQPALLTYPNLKVLFVLVPKLIRAYY